MTTLLLLLCTAGLVTHTQDCAQAAHEALELCISTVIPSLFPFMVLSSLLTGCGAVTPGRHLSGLMRPLFHLSSAGSGALVLGLVGGYPMGARAVAELVRGGSLAHDEGERLLAFCNNAGPGFILGMCGTAMFHSARAGAWLYLVHVSGALLTGMLLRGNSSQPLQKVAAPPQRTLAQALSPAVRSSCAGMATVCGFAVLFTVLSRMAAGLTDTLSVLMRAALLGALELTGGVLMLPDTRGGFVLCAALLGWGGLSVHAQTLSMLEGSGLHMRRYFLGKLLHALVSAVLAAFIVPWALS